MYDIIISLEVISAMNECINQVEGVHREFEDCSKCKIYNIVNLSITNMYDQLKSLSLYDFGIIEKTELIADEKVFAKMITAANADIYHWTVI